MTDRELMQVALNALRLCSALPNWPAFIPVTKDLEARLAQPEQRPVAWIDWDEEGWAFLTTESCGVPLYRDPPQREWVGLTDKEHEQIAIDCGCASADWVFYGAAVERKLKEKNNG